MQRYQDPETSSGLYMSSNSMTKESIAVVGVAVIAMTFCGNVVGQVCPTYKLALYRFHLFYQGEVWNFNFLI